MILTNGITWGVPEVIEDDKTGFLVQHGDVDQLAALLHTPFANPLLAREMGGRGLKRVDKEFRFDTFAESLKQILCHLCES